MKKNLFFLSIAMLSVLFVGCKPKPGPDSTIEALIKTISIKNTTYTGEVDNTTYTVTFNDVAAETNIEAIQFTTKLSLGAKLDKETYDFTTGASEDGKQLVQTIKVINGTVEQAYTVVINLLDPVSDPMLDALYMKKGTNGEEVKALIFDGAVALGMPDETEAIFSKISVIPARATYKFTAMQEDKLSAANPGKLEIEFMGRKTSFDITFAAAPTPGVDFAAAVVHDFSVATPKAPAEFATENTRGTDFDGEHVLVVSRNDDGSAYPHLYKVSDLLADNAGNKIAHHHSAEPHLALQLGHEHRVDTPHHKSQRIDPQGEGQLRIVVVGCNTGCRHPQQGNDYQRDDQADVEHRGVVGKGGLLVLHKCRIQSTVDQHDGEIDEYHYQGNPSELRGREQASQNDAYYQSQPLDQQPLGELVDQRGYDLTTTHRRLNSPPPECHFIESTA
jgi:hypothetical protein